MRNVFQRLTVLAAAVALAGCTATSGQKLSASRSPSETSRPGATAVPATTATATATATVDAPAPSAGVPRSSPPPQTQPPARRLLLTRQGLGEVPVGATLGKFTEALGSSPTPMSAMDRSVFANHSCVIRQLARLRGVGLMVIGHDPAGPVRLISIYGGSDIRTDTGIGLGSSLRAVRAAYGPGLDEPFDHYPVGGEAVLVQAGANRYLAFIGNTQDRVVELRLGFKPEVTYSEGCV